MDSAPGAEMTRRDDPVAITGATGAVGGRVVRGLSDTGVPLRLVVRPGHDFQPDPPYEIREAAGYGDAEGMRAALEGARTLFLIPASESAKRIDEHRAAVKAAVETGVRKIVYLSFFGAAPDSTFTLARDHYLTEEAVRDSGLKWTFLRMNLYTDFLPAMTLADGEIRGPAGDGRLAAITRDDVAAAAVAILVAGGHDGETLDLTGPEAFTLAEAAETMSVASGKSIRYLEETDEEAYSSREVYDAPRWELEGWVSTYQAIRDGSLSGVSGDFERLVGRRSGTLSEFVEANPGALDHVAT